eukprot:TRINITY_DN9319_c0_g1::TRINITY_DN9319_c0_g1_i1::g.28374::m.28374 TRINITY_DN9319_c0_g1::TRINITY_DN9319_c0_g1_i1::g.28374  ORF type:complete len:134 (+),score=-7.52,DUF3146/PF11344.3/4.7,DUF3146/PF11344.3/13 TRINITY_DN9319_c0_g1_i1:47-448(+)
MMNTVTAEAVLDLLHPEEETVARDLVLARDLHLKPALQRGMSAAALDRLLVAPDLVLQLKPALQRGMSAAALDRLLVDPDLAHLLLDLPPDPLLVLPRVLPPRAEILPTATTECQMYPINCRCSSRQIILCST